MQPLKLVRKLHFALAAVIAISACTRVANDSRGTSFRRETGMPAAPPEAFLIDVHTRISGVRYTADWVTRERTFLQPPAIPVPWPRDLAKRPNDHVAILFATHVEPEHVLIQAYRSVDARGRPTSGPASTVECDAASNCFFRHVDNDTMLDAHLDANARFVVVFAYWHVPIVRVAHEGPTAVSASWLFVRGRSSRGLKS